MMAAAALRLPLLPTFVSMLVPPFSLTSNSCAFCITARNCEIDEKQMQNLHVKYTST